MKTATRSLHTLCLALFLTLPASPPVAVAMESEQCLGCHSSVDMVGEDFFIEQSTFDHTAHAAMGCSACHESVTEEHPDDGLSPSRAGCQDCHDGIDAEYAGSSHAMFASCGDCHNPHSVLGPKEVSGHDMNRQCAACHAKTETVSLHSEWLPQAELHISMLPCITCHTASQDYVITLYIIGREGDPTAGDFEPASYEELQTLAGGNDIRSLIDTNGDNYISITELRLFNRNPAYETMRLQGMMTPEVVTHDLGILENRWDCTFCHASGPQAMQTSFVALPESGGMYERLAVEKGAVLDALNGTPDFYMVGSTRSTLLNYLGVVIIAGGLVMPVGHGALRFLTRKNRKRKEHTS